MMAREGGRECGTYDGGGLKGVHSIQEVVYRPWAVMDKCFLVAIGLLSSALDRHRHTHTHTSFNNNSDGPISLA